MNKICTTIEQSQKLIELGIDVNTADMMWDDWSLIDEGWKLSIGYHPEIEKDYGRKCYPAWSLAALLDMLNYPTLMHEFCGSEKEKWFLTIEDPEETYRVWENDPIDACYEMILKLHELNLL